MLILAKSILAMMIGFLASAILGLIILPILRRTKIRQNISKFVTMHSKKNGTPTMGGIIFILSTFFSILLLFLLGKIDVSYNIIIILFVFLSYALIGFLDDYLNIKRKNNTGLKKTQKLLLQILVSVVFYYLYTKGGGNSILDIHTLNIKIDLGIMFSGFILFLLVGTSNAVNITDGLDGLSGGLSLIAFLAFGMISWGASWVTGNQDIAVFCFILTGAILGFLLYNTHPAKMFMGDTGSLPLGATLASVAIITNHELTLVVVGGVFVIETLSVIIQIASIKIFKKKVFLMSPLHHHFEKLGWQETDIVKLFWVVGLISGMAAIIFGVWL